MTRHSGQPPVNHAMVNSAAEFASPIRAANILFTGTAIAFWRLDQEAQVEDRSAMSLFAIFSKVASIIDFIVICHHTVVMNNNTD